MDLARGQSVKRFPQTLVALAALRKILRLRWRPSKDELSGPQATGKCSTKDFIPATAPSRSFGGIAFLITATSGFLLLGLDHEDKMAIIALRRRQSDVSALPAGKTAEQRLY